MPGRLRAAPLPWRYAALSLLVSVVVALAYLVSSVSTIEGQTLNWRFQLRGSHAPPPQVVIIAIDDRTVAKLGHSPVPHHDLAAGIEKLSAGGATAIGIDMLFLEHEQPWNGLQLSAGDQALFDALRLSARSVLPIAFTLVPAAKPSEAALQIAEKAAFRVVSRPSGNAGGDIPLRGTDMRVPFSPLPSVAGLGHVNMPVDPDGTLRYMPAAIAFGEHYLPAFPIELARRSLSLTTGDIALLLGGKVIFGKRELQLDPRLGLPINYYGPPGTIPTFPLSDLLEGHVPPAAIAGHAVLLGVTALGLGDNFVTPFSQTMPGVEVLATITGNLLSGQILQHASLRGWNIAAILLLGLAAFALARLPLPLAATGAIVGLLALWSAIALVAFQQNLWLDMTFPAAAILLNAGGVAILRAGIERRMRRNLARYHSPVIVDMLARSATPNFGGSQNAAILFVDIAGFTSRMERMAPDDTVRFLRDFHGRIERAVLAHGGVLEQFMGDGAMVVFGVPEPKPQDAVAALTCARDLFEDIRGRNAELAAEGEAPFRISVGIHCGPVVVASLGGPTQAQMSTSGDTVNVASRLEALTREHGAAIAISGAVVEAVTAAGRADLLAGFELLATDKVRGRVG
ncbi:MAG TPA: adenylate/guanylate cyclase domain-containing protein, partial [Dongiaceae bacterium]